MHLENFSYICALSLHFLRNRILKLMVKCKLVQEEPVLKRFIDFRHFRANFLLLYISWWLLCLDFWRTKCGLEIDTIPKINKENFPQARNFSIILTRQQKSDFFRVKTRFLKCEKSLASLSKISHADNPWLHSVCYWSEINKIINEEKNQGLSNPRLSIQIKNGLIAE